MNDPWIQQEWGLLLVASGRLQESLAHLDVAGGACPAPRLAAWPGSCIGLHCAWPTGFLLGVLPLACTFQLPCRRLHPTLLPSVPAGRIFAAQIGGPGHTPAEQVAQLAAVLDPTGQRRITDREAGGAAMSAFRHARHAMAALGAAAGKQVDQAALRRGLCHLQQLECGAAQLMLPLAGSGSDGPASSSGDSPAAQTLQECLARAKALGCPVTQQTQLQASGSGERDSGSSVEMGAAKDEL